MLIIPLQKELRLLPYEVTGKVQPHHRYHRRLLAVLWTPWTSRCLLCLISSPSPSRLVRLRSLPAANSLSLIMTRWFLLRDQRLSLPWNHVPHSLSMSSLILTGQVANQFLDAKSLICNVRCYHGQNACLHHKYSLDNGRTNSLPSLLVLAYHQFSQTHK